LTKLIYMISNEVGRGRATHATLQTVNRWKTVALITGEIGIVLTNLNGAAVRVVLISKKMKTMPVGVVEKSLVGISNNYGHIIELFMEKLLKNKDEYKLKFDEIQKQFMHNDQSSMVNRSANAYAAIATAGIILEDVFVDIGIPKVDPVELVEDFFKEATENLNEPYSIKALRYLYDYIQIHQNSFVKNDNDLNLNREIFGYISEDYIDMYKQSTKDALKEGSFNNSVIKNWINDGIIKVNKNRLDFKVTKSSVVHYLYRFDISKIQEKLGD
jgi:putative DNA primase/helicase